MPHASSFFSLIPCSVREQVTIVLLLPIPRVSILIPGFGKSRIYLVAFFI